MEDASSADDRPPELVELMAYLAENGPPLTPEEEAAIERFKARMAQRREGGQGE